MNNTVNIIILTGYSRTGKSTLIRKLESYGWLVGSSSEALGSVADRILIHIGDMSERMVEELRGSPDDHSWNINEFCYGNIVTYRDFKIAVAEQVLIPVFSRSLFALAATRCLDEFDPSSHVGIVIESVGGEETQLILNNIWQKMGDRAIVHRFHAHTDGINHSGDIRVIDPESQPIFTQYPDGTWKPTEDVVQELVQKVAETDLDVVE